VPTCWLPPGRCWRRTGGAGRAWRSPTSIPTWTSHYLAAPPPGRDAGPQTQRILATLPDHYRRILELRFLEGYSIKESARALTISVSNAKVMQYRALRMAARTAEEGDR
jgi:DNA-directed RNA polymerase specialized sigma24 family protein